MPYSETVKPKPTYTVVVKLLEVTPAYKISTGLVQTFDRTSEEVLGLVVRADTEVEAIERAVGMLDTHKAAVE